MARVGRVFLRVYSLHRDVIKRVSRTINGREYHSKCRAIVLNLISASACVCVSERTEQERRRRKKKRIREASENSGTNHLSVSFKNHLLFLYMTFTYLINFQRALQHIHVVSYHLRVKTILITRIKHFYHIIMWILTRKVEI